MAYITEREKALQYVRQLNEKKVSMGLFCTASHWNTEAILYAAKDYAERHGIKEIPVAIGMTYNYSHMPQAQRVTYCKDPKVGFLSVMNHLKILCGDKDAPYGNVVVLPHLDHADPVRDIWPLTEGLDYLASVMFDAQEYTLEENMRLTLEYVEKYGGKVLVEGVMDKLSVNGTNVKSEGRGYIEKAVKFVNETKVDFLVADLGTEQQSISAGRCTYMNDRARSLTEALGRKMLVMHGTSCLTRDQMEGLAEDGIVRVNMWTRIVREAGQYAAEKMFCRARSIFMGKDFEKIESRKYIYDSIAKSAEIIEDTLEILGYSKLA